MTPLIQQLTTLLQRVKLAPGTSPQAITDLLRATAAASIRQDPSQAQVPPGDLDPMIVDAIQQGAQQAAAFEAAGIVPRPGLEQLPIGIGPSDLGLGPANLAERPATLLGPFVLDDFTLVRFVEIQSAPFRTVNERQGGGGGVPVSSGDLLMLLPHGATPDAPDNLSWTLPAGTVWIQSRFLPAGATGFAGLRIAGGKLLFRANPLFRGLLLPQPGSVWTLSVQPEALPPANGAGTDAEAITLQLPALLEVHSNLPAAITGGLLFSGFGSTLHLNPAGAAFAETDQISFPLQAEETTLSIAGNASGLTQFSGECNPQNPRFTIPTVTTLPEQLGEAAHGGSIVLTLGAGLTSTFKAQSGDAFRWTAATLTANTARLEIQSLSPDSGARYDFGVWGTSLSEVRFLPRDATDAGLPLTRLVFRSERAAFETLAAFGGSCINKWDSPSTADGPPFAFNAGLDIFGFLSTPSGDLLTITASVPANANLDSAGLALENLYSIVRGPRHLFLLAPAGDAPLLPAGNAQLRFDVDVAIPTLPDPYASNLGPTPDPAGLTELALRIALTWTGAAAPAIAANLDQNVRFPNPHFLPADDVDEQTLYFSFQGHLQSGFEFLYLLDLSSREHLFGVALEPLLNNKPEIIDNRLSVPLSRVRLLLQPQVQWEPVLFVPGPVALKEEVAHSKLNGGPTLVGANSLKLTPVLPGSLSLGIMDAIAGKNPAAALFSLPFGLRAMAKLDFVPFVIQEPSPATISVLNEPVFDGFASARQIRLLARATRGFADDPSRIMPGSMRQLANLLPNQSNLASVLPNELRQEVGNQFSSGVPLHHADLSGYGLSTFSEWHQNDVPGPNFSKIEFRVLNGRTAYEVVQFRSILYECGARVIRTVVLERSNTGLVNRTDTGWVAMDDGDFARPIPFEKGALTSLQNIRRIRILPVPPIDLDGSASVQPVIFDADAAIDGSLTGIVPIYDRPGYIQIKPVAPVKPQPGQAPDALDLSPFQLQILFDQVGPIASSVDCAARVAGTLDTQISGIVSDFAPGDANEIESPIGFAVAVVGTPKLPRAGQWTFVRVDPQSGKTSAVDPRRGVPLVRHGADVYRFREPADARLLKSSSIDYALLMATETSRALFRRPELNPAVPGTLQFGAPPILADPYSLVQSAGAFPQANLALQVNETPAFQITDDNLWRIDTTSFTVAAGAKPTGDLLKGGGWGLARDYADDAITLNIDSGAPAAVHVETPVADLNLKINLPEPLNQILKIVTKYKSIAGGPPQLDNPTLKFSGALDALQQILNSLQGLFGLFPFDVTVKAGTGATPSFVVHMELVFRIGDGPDGRIDVGMGKFYGQFLVRGEFEAALTGVDRALLFLEFQGDIQQAILPPLLYAGGLFRFSIELRETGPPAIDVTLGLVISLGGDLIPGLMAVEATLNEGYSLDPATLDVGVLLGIEARAKLLGGLVGFSFSAEVMARIKRHDFATVNIWAQIRVAATVQLAIFFKEDIHFDTQFQQAVPLAAVVLVPGVGLAVLPAAVPL